ncbi:pentatricopeptide repeat containing protein [Colletotrichum sojae]|uniref:Pentatricopeptide repeat containing protein n=1 Tax=Colletotrichum sojae TaxID=2175907 RepID=A0A8H6JK22_9PEZI|nr:pentatricopeptide repeat containing protein [Colletotrichum sojae]
MLACAACLKRAIKPVVSAGSFPETPRALQHSLLLRRQLPRFFSVNRTTTAQAKESKKEDFLSAKADDPSAKRSQQKLEWAVGKHLEHMSDPWKIAKHVEATLEKDRFDEALLLTKRASVGKQCVVAWNHLIDYEIRKQKRLGAAIKLYNDMKKRGQIPNDQTYTILFRGCGFSQHPESAVQKAVHIYKSLLRGERLKPNTIHMNAVLQVCGRAGDIETMFEIAGSADAKEGRRADAHTYTIILNSMRAKAQPKKEAGVGSLTQQEPQENRQEARQALERSRVIWEEVVREWRGGRVTMDESLVSAMCRILLLGEAGDRLEVFKILEQTMSIPNFTLPQNRPVPDRRYVQNMHADMRNICAFSSREPKRVRKLRNVTYAIPGCRTLSLILATIRKVDRRAIKTGSISNQYWHIFTNYYSLRPDADNYSHMLSIFEHNGSSSGALELIKMMPQNLVTSSIIRRGLRACLADYANPHVTANATAMLIRLPAPDVASLLIYHQVAAVARSDKTGEKLALAINTLWKPFKKAMNSLEKEDTSLQTSKPGKAKEGKSTVCYQDDQDFVRDLLVLARAMIGTVDKIVAGRLINGDALKKLKLKRNGMNRFVVQHTDPQQNEGLASREAKSED